MLYRGRHMLWKGHGNTFWDEVPPLSCLDKRGTTSWREGVSSSSWKGAVVRGPAMHTRKVDFQGSKLYIICYSGLIQPKPIFCFCLVRTQVVHNGVQVVHNVEFSRTSHHMVFGWSLQRGFGKLLRSRRTKWTSVSPCAFIFCVTFLSCLLEPKLWKLVAEKWTLRGMSQW